MHIPLHRVTTSALCIATTLSLTFASFAQQTAAQNKNSQIIDQGPHHNLHHWTTEQTWPDGRVTVEPHYITELASGLNYVKDGKWVPSVEEIEIFADGAIARQGQHQVIFAPNLNSEGVIDLQTPDGTRLRSHLLGVAYMDSATGHSVMIAEPKDSIGEVIGNQVIYRDAFAGPFRADVRFTYSRSGFEQDVIFHEAPPPPEEYDMDSSSVRLEIWTEFLQPPVATSEAQMLRQETDPAVRQARLIPDLYDETLSFGTMQIGSGRAFMLGKSDRDNSSVGVAKSWVRVEGRQFLIEALEWNDAAPLLNEVKRASSAPKLLKRIRGQAMRVFPPAPGVKPRKPLQIALAGVTGKALVMDYQLLNSSLTNFTFAADQTYGIGGPVNLYGTNNLIEGGTVIKFSQGVGATIDVKGALLGDTDMYRPAVLTALDDDTIGELAGSGNPPTGSYATIALNFDYATSSKLAALQNIRILHALTAVRFNGGNGHVLRHVQIGNCGAAVQANSSAVYAMRNVLTWNSTNALTGSSGCIGVWEHGTFNQVSRLITTVTGRMTNCLLTVVSNTTGISGASNIVLASSAGIYETAFHGRHYLATASPYRDIGWTNINPTLAAELKKRTTRAPVVLGNVSMNTVVSALPIRDTSLPDIGFHYSPLDYLASGVVVSTNVTLTLSNGVAVGVDYTNSGWGFDLRDARLHSIGLPTQFNYFGRSHMAQEGSGGNAGSRALVYDGGSLGVRQCALRMRFTEMSQLPDDGYLLYVGTKFGVLEWSHSRVYNPSLVIDTSGTGTLVCGLTNTLWERGGIMLGVGNSTGNSVTAHLRNNLIRKVGAWHFFKGSNTWTVRDNLFDTVGLVANNGSYVENSTNAYFATTYGLTSGTGNIALATLTYQYQTNLQGKYYLPTGSSLINAGSRTADQAGLYHFTTTTNQVKDAATQVDIGLHYVALTASGQPADGDADGFPDYIEDANGNGIADVTETDWTVWTPELKIFITYPNPSFILP